MLGLDPLYVANEGKLVAVVPPRDADRLLDVMRGHPLGRQAAMIGEIVDEHPRHGDLAVAYRRRTCRHDVGGRTITENLLRRITMVETEWDLCQT